MPSPRLIPCLRRALPALAMAALAALPLYARSVLDLSDPQAPRLEGKTPQELFPWATFDPAVPTQEQVTGVRPGTRPLRHGELLAYLEALAEASPRAVLRDYAVSWEGRRLVYLAVSDAPTIAALDAFRAEHARRTDPRAAAGAGEAEAAAGAKAVAWMAYAIHGDELSSADAAAALAYWLVAGEDERAATLRRELVVLIDPCENPDGRDRFLAQTAAFAHRRPNPDPEDLSHATVWPWGRGNHYLFDLNRDWFTLIQPESARSGVIASWNPQLVVDSHEMGPHDTYLFPPPRHPFNPLLPPDALDWWRRFAEDQARALDARGYGYYTREWNEEFFPGYGSSWASYLGAIGILYEMSSTEGTLVHQRRGVLRTYPQAVEHHVASSVANLETLARHRAEVLHAFVAGRRAAVPSGPTVRAWVLTPERNADWARELAGRLRAQGIEVLSNDEPVEARGLRAIRTGEGQDRVLPPGSFLVRTDQPAGRLVRVLLDPHVPMDAAFLREEREYLERGKGSRLYDTTAWSLPLLFGVEAFWTDALPAGAWRPWAPEGEGGASGREVFVRQARPEVFGYLLDGSSDRALFAVADLLARGVRVQVADRPFRVGGRRYPRGSFLIPREANPGDLRGVLEPVAARRRVTFAGTVTARAEEGPDLGGRHFRPLVSPRVGVWTGYPVSPSDYGSVWHLLDVEADLRFTALDLGRFGSADLSRYNVLVFPPAMGGGGAYADALGESGIERLRRWVEAGGTAVALGSAVEFFADPGHGLSAARLRRDVLDTYTPVVVGLSAEAAEAAGRPRAVGMKAPEPAQGAPEAGPSDAASRRRGRRRAAEEPGPPSSPYDVAPLLGPGARPFARGVPQPTVLPLEPVDLATWVRAWLPPGMKEPDLDILRRADDRLRRFAPRGALLRVDLDPEHYLDWGLPWEIAVWFGTSRALVAEPPVNVAARFETLDRLHLGGLLWPEAAGRIALTAYATQESVGRGQVVLFAERPTYRGWPRESRRMFLNAVVVGPGVGTRWPDPW